MENASKALIIAGGVLIGIMVASIFVYLFTTYGDYSETMYNRIYQRQQAQANNEYTQYEGSSENTIYDVVTVINKAKDNNTSLKLSSGERGYISVRIANGVTGAPHTDLEMLNNAEIVELLQTYVDLDATFKCNVYEQDNSINMVVFSKN